MTEEPDNTAALRHAMSTETRDHHLDPSAARAAWSAARATRPHRARTVLAVAAGVIVVVVGATAVAKTLGNDTTTAATTSTGPSACTGNITTSALPTWARAGFSPPDLPTSHVLSANGTIVAVPGDLRAHQPTGVFNKILWVAKDGTRWPARPASLHIAAQLEGSDTVVTRTVDLGPSTVDLPAAGCWRMTLTWPGHRDTIALRYR